MRKTITALCTFFALTMGAAISYAEPVTLMAGSGSKEGVYYPVIHEMGQFCNSDNLSIQHYMVNGKPEGGSINNLRNLLNNKIALGVVQADVAHLEKMNNPDMARIQAILPLHLEQVHIIVPRFVSVQTQAATKGVLGVGAKEAQFANQENSIKDVSQLASRKAAMWGGTLKSGEVIKLMGNVGFEIVRAEDEKDAMAKLDRREVSAVLAVVGAPAKWIEGLPRGKYQLISIQSVKEKLKSIYGTRTVSYDNLGANGQAIEALSVDSILFTRKYTIPKMVNALAELQACVRKKIGEIQDTGTTHPVWQQIDPARLIKWDNIFKK